MRKVLAILTVSGGIMLSACGSDSSSSFTTEDGDTGEYSVDSETGEASITVETDSGTAMMRSGSDVPVDLPDGFSIYPGADVVSNTVFAQGEGKGALITIESEDSPEEIADFYRKQAEAAGVEISMELSVNEGKMIGGESPDGLTFSINASPAEEGATAQLAIGENISN